MTHPALWGALPLLVISKVGLGGSELWLALIWCCRDDPA